MAEKVKVARASDIAEGTALQAEVNGRQVSLFRVGGQLHATDGVCPHRGGPLGEGFLQGTTVSCPWHGWRFDVTTGACLNNPSAKVERVPVTVEGDDVYVSF